MAKKPRTRGRKPGGPEKAPESEGMLTNAARAIGTALGTLSAKAKAIEIPKPPTLEEAKASLGKLRLPFSKKKAKPRRRSRAARRSPD